VVVAAVDDGTIILDVVVICIVVETCLVVVVTCVVVVGAIIQQTNKLLVAFAPMFYLRGSNKW